MKYVIEEVLAATVFVLLLVVMLLSFVIAEPRPHVDEQPFEGTDKTQLHPVAVRRFTATAVLKDSCTWCGKEPK